MEKTNHKPAVGVSEPSGVQGIISSFESSISSLNERIRITQSPAATTVSFKQQSDLISMQRRTILSDALSAFKEKHADKLTPRESLKFKFALTERTGIAEMYLNLDENEKDLFIEDFSEKASNT